MTDAVTVDHLFVRVSRQEVLRNLGYPRAHQPTERVALKLDELWPEADALIQAKGAFRVVTSQQAATAAMPHPTDQVGLGVCTIGPALEDREHQLSASDRMLEALLLDAFGSAAAESAADALNLLLCVHAQALDLKLLPRFSPGYGSWDVKHQRQLLAMLPAQRVGIRLTEGMMMIPRKSVSFAVRLSPDAEAGRTDRRHCARCDLQGCAYRAEPQVDVNRDIGFAKK